MDGEKNKEVELDTTGLARASFWYLYTGGRDGYW